MELIVTECAEASPSCGARQKLGQLSLRLYSMEKVDSRWSVNQPSAM